MSIFNSNLRFMCKKKGLGQQALADIFGMKRGKVAGYFYETQPKPDFFEKLTETFQLDIGKFLTVEMTDVNYESFFLEIKQKVNASYENSNVIDLLLKAKTVDDKRELVSLLDEAAVLFGKIMQENSLLKDELIEELRKR